MAKLVIGEYEVSVTAVCKYIGVKSDTLSFLNEMAVAFNDAALYNSEHGYKGLEKKYGEMGKQLYNYCKESGLYEGLN